ncbi:MAG: hypothetical protein HZA69_04415, partial [Gammaproteobacteria bacterium]|nr:hypothetical protein [Gammaproteobacteria bacterium]
MAAISIPAFVALLFKLALLAYAGSALKRSPAAGLYFLLLLVLALHNLVEFAGLNHFSEHGLTQTMQHYGFAYVALLVPAIALILHISLRLSFNDSVFAGRSHLLLLIYLPVIPLEYLLWFTDSLVSGFRTFQYTVLRVPGPWYSVFETYVVVYLLASLTNLVYGARGSRTPAIHRTRNRLWLLALAPTLLLLVYLIVANRFGWTKLTSTVYLPLTLTFFLVVTTYATYQYRLFDIELYIPWSKVRARKTAFYNRIRAMTAEIADLSSVRDAVGRLAETLHCPVALVSTGKPVLAVAGGAQQMVAFPLQQLRDIDHIVVANEIADTAPEAYALMRSHGV